MEREQITNSPLDLLSFLLHLACAHPISTDRSAGTTRKTLESKSKGLTRQEICKLLLCTSNGIKLYQFHNIAQQKRKKKSKQHCVTAAVNSGNELAALPPQRVTLTLSDVDDGPGLCCIRASQERRPTFVSDYIYLPKRAQWSGPSGAPTARTKQTASHTGWLIMVFAFARSGGDRLCQCK